MRTLRPTRCMATVPHRRGRLLALSVALAEGIVATQRAILDVQPDASFVYVEAAFRYAGDSFPIPKEILDERRFVVLDLVLGRVDADHPIRDWLVRHGADIGGLERMTHDPVLPDVLGVNYYPAFSTVSFDDAGEPSGSKQARTASPRSCGSTRRATTDR